MESNKQLKKSFKELKIEAMLRSILFGLSIGFVIGFVIFIVGIITTKNLLWFGLGVGGGVALILSSLLYMIPFKPTIKKVAERIDGMGLEERTITMVELKESDTYIAKVQRENATQAIDELSPKLLSFSSFIRLGVVFSVSLVIMVVSLSFMIIRVNAAAIDPTDPNTTEETTEREDFEEMIDELLSIISESNIEISLKNTLYGMVVDLENRLPTYDTYLEKYADVLETRNEILQMIADAEKVIEDQMKNIAEALQQYENTEILGDALLTWDPQEIEDAFDFMYDRIEVLMGQELYDVMMQTADDIEAALAEAIGTDPAMAEALQALADAYRLPLEGFEPGDEPEVLDELESGMNESMQALIDAVEALLEALEELEDLEEELEEATEVEFPEFLPNPSDESDEGDLPDDPDSESLNTVIDGQTPYTDVYDQYYQDAMNWLAGDNASDEMRRIIEDYFNMLE